MTVIKLTLPLRPTRSRRWMSEALCAATSDRTVMPYSRGNRPPLTSEPATADVIHLHQKAAG